MSRNCRPSSVYADLINSFKNQCNSLISTFKIKNYEQFSDFAELFKTFKFGLIYEKHADSFFYDDFKAVSLQIAKDLMLNYNFLGGLYLLYGLYFVQDEPKHSIRLEFSEFEKIMEFLKEERSTPLVTCQPGFVFAKLLRYDAFTFPYFVRDFKMEGKNKTRLVDSNSHFWKEGIDKKQWLSNFLEQCDVVNDLKRVDKEYLKKKRKLKEEHRDLNLALDMVSEDTLGNLMKSIADADKRESKPSIDIGTRRRFLKQRALKRKLNYMQQSSSIKKEDDISQREKKIGRPRGLRQSYLNLLVNKTELTSSSSDSDVDGCLLDMPEVV